MQFFFALHDLNHQKNMQNSVVPSGFKHISAAILFKNLRFRWFFTSQR